MSEQEGHPPGTEPQTIPEQDTLAQPAAPASEGKPAEDASALKARLEEKESFIGRQTNEIGDLRSKVGYLQSQMEALERLRERPVGQPPAEGTRPKFNWEDPDTSIEQIVQSRLKAAENQRMQQDTERRAQVAYSNFTNSWNQAMKSDPKLYDGIEGIVQETVKNSYRSGIVNEYSITPDTIKMAAQMIRLQRGENKYFAPPQVTPVQPTASETPGARPMRQEELSVEIDEGTRRYAKERGLSEKQVQEILQKELKAKAKGQNAARLGYGAD
jgi:hypothetical protein